MPCYDLVVKNAKIVDGTGNPWFWGDVGVKGGKVSYVGRLPEDVCADEIIDSMGQVLSPGFIDCHAHSDFMLFRDPTMLSKLKQGVTTQMIGPCGISPAPIKRERVELLDKYAGFAKAGANVDLYRGFLKRHILTESGKYFIGLGKNYVRFRVTANLDKIIKTIKDIEEVC